MEENGERVGAGDIETFRKEVTERLDLEKGVLATVTQPRKWRMFGYGMAVALLIVCISVIIMRPNGFILWVLSSYILVSLAWLILFLPTSKKEPGFVRQRNTYRRKNMKGSIKTIAKRRKRLFAEVWIDAFLYGNALPTIAVSVIFGISIVCAIYYGLIADEIPGDLMRVIIVQGFALILLRVILIVYRPYARGTLSVPGAFKGKLSTARRRGKMAMAIATIVVLLAVAVTGFVIVMGFLLPGATRERVWDFLTSDGNANLYTVILMFVIMYVIWRHLQSIMSTSMAMRISASRVRKFEEDVARPLEKAIAESGAGGMRRTDLEDLRLAFYRIAIFRYVKHDFFGIAPLHLIAPDMRYLLDERVLDALTKAEGIGGEAGRRI